MYIQLLLCVYVLGYFLYLEVISCHLQTDCKYIEGNA